jgi:hypothetical protein
MSGKYVNVLLQIGDCSSESIALTSVLRKENSVTNRNVVQSLAWTKPTFPIMLSDVGHGTLEKPVVFCTGEERADRSLHRKMLMESRKRFFEAHKNKLHVRVCG